MIGYSNLLIIFATNQTIFLLKILISKDLKRGKFYLKVDKNFSSQECSNCGSFIGKKALNERVHNCPVCHHSESRDTNSAKILMQRGQNAVGHTVIKNACGGDATGFKQLSLFELVSS